VTSPGRSKATSAPFSFCNVAREPLEALLVAGADPHARVHIEAVAVAWLGFALVAAAIGLMSGARPNSLMTRLPAFCPKMSVPATEPA
jgi:hypothetical protein